MGGKKTVKMLTKYSVQDIDPSQYQQGVQPLD